MDDRAWADFRARLRTRTSRQMALIICPIIILIELMDYPVGDPRNSVAFRVVVYGLFIALAVVGIIASARWLLADRRRAR